MLDEGEAARNQRHRGSHTFTKGAPHHPHLAHLERLGDMADKG